MENNAASASIESTRFSPPPIKSPMPVSYTHTVEWITRMTAMVENKTGDDGSGHNRTIDAKLPPAPGRSSRISKPTYKAKALRDDYEAGYQLNRDYIFLPPEEADSTESYIHMTLTEATYIRLHTHHSIITSNKPIRIHLLVKPPRSMQSVTWILGRKNLLPGFTVAEKKRILESGPESLYAHQFGLKEVVLRENGSLSTLLKDVRGGVSIRVVVGDESGLKEESFLLPPIPQRWYQRPKPKVRKRVNAARRTAVPPGPGEPKRGRGRPKKSPLLLPKPAEAQVQHTVLVPKKKENIPIKPRTGANLPSNAGSGMSGVTTLLLRGPDGKFVSRESLERSMMSGGKCTGAHADRGMLQSVMFGRI